MDGYKAKLPRELMEAMKLDEDQFEELEKQTLDLAIQFLQQMPFKLTVPTPMEFAWRPSENRRGQYFAIRHTIMHSPIDYSVCLEVDGFKMMDKEEYRSYCIKEYGGDPFLGDASLN